MIALGHHYDDAVETFFLSLFYEGRLSCFQPVTYLDRMGITQIRPLLYCGEGMVRGAAKRHNLPIVHNPCPADVNTRRQEVKELVAELSKTYPNLKNYVFGAMQRLPLPEWGPREYRRPPLGGGANKRTLTRKMPWCNQAPRHFVSVRIFSVSTPASPQKPQTVMPHSPRPRLSPGARCSER